MPLDSVTGGQMITFATEHDDDRRFDQWVWVHVREGDTVAKIAARHGHPEDARKIADKNEIRSVRQILRPTPAQAIGETVGLAQSQARRQRIRHKIKVPGELRPSLGFSVLAGDEPPAVTSGYAKFSTVDRPQRVGLNIFDGYDPLEMDVPVQFENYTRQRDNGGASIETDIETLERMAGRGKFAGAGVGPPPVIRVTTTDGTGAPIPLIPLNYQWTRDSDGPLWRIQGISWEPGALRNPDGNRIRQVATVHLKEHTRFSLLSRSAAHRSRSRDGTSAGAAIGKTVAGGI